MTTYNFYIAQAQSYIDDLQKGTMHVPIDMSISKNFVPFDMSIGTNFVPFDMSKRGKFTAITSIKIYNRGHSL